MALVFKSTLPVLFLLLLKDLIDLITEVDSTTPNALFPLLVSIFILHFLIMLTEFANRIATEHLQHYVKVQVSELIQKKSSSVSMVYYDTPEYYNKLHRAQLESAHRPFQITNAFANVLSSSLLLVSLIWILMTYHWALPLILIIPLVPFFIFQLINVKRLFNWFTSTTEQQRESRYYHYINTTASFAKEVRLFGVGKWALNRYLNIESKLHKDKQKQMRPVYILMLLISLVEAILFIFVLGTLANSTLEGIISVGSLVLYYQAFDKAQKSLKGFNQDILDLFSHKLFLRNLIEFLSIETHGRNSLEPTECSNTPVKRIDLINVSFTHPFQQKPTTKDLSFTLLSDRIYAITGSNGSGKTTLLKLLSRLYFPEKGSILFNGIEVSTQNQGEFKNQVSAIFQDFARYHVSGRENILIGNLGQHEDLERVRLVSKLTDVQKIFSSLPSGDSTKLGNSFAGGHELSEGQWQKIALARCIYSKASVLLFDEPTTSLDASSKKQFWNTIKSISQNKIVLIVTHDEHILNQVDEVINLEGNLAFSQVG